MNRVLVVRRPDVAATLAERCSLAPDELEVRRDAAHGLYCPEPNAQGVFEQVEVFFGLEDGTPPREERFKAPINRLFDWDRINRLKLSQSAEVSGQHSTAGGPR